MDAVGTRVAGAAAWARWGIRDGCGGLRLKAQRVASGQKGVARVGEKGNRRSHNPGRAFSFAGGNLPTSLAL
jgi:hypothetical protein